MNMLKGGIAIDAWKLPIFERRLTQAGYTFKNHGELTPGVLLLRVDTENAQALAQVILAANTEGRENRSAKAMSNPPRWFTRAEERLAANEERIPTGSDIHLLEMAVNDYRALNASCELLRAALDAKGPRPEPHRNHDKIVEMAGERGRQFDAHFGYGTFTDWDYRQDVCTWTAAWNTALSSGLSLADSGDSAVKGMRTGAQCLHPGGLPCSECGAQPAVYPEGPSEPVALVLAEIVAERASQDQKWGGAAHDDQHSLEDFGGLIANYLSRARSAMGHRDPLWRSKRVRRRLVQVAALACAAVERMDRAANSLDRALLSTPPQT